MKHRNRASQINAIEARNSQGKIEHWQLYKAESGIWTLRSPSGEVIEFDTTMHKSKETIKRCLQNRGLRAEI